MMHMGIKVAVINSVAFLASYSETVISSVLASVPIDAGVTTVIFSKLLLALAKDWMYNPHRAQLIATV